MPASPARDDRAFAGRLVEDALASMPRGIGPSQADLFIEHSLRDVRGVSLVRDDERVHVPVLREDRGAALRALSNDISRLAHVAGDADERLERLAREWRVGGTSEALGARDDAAAPRSSDGAMAIPPAHPLLAQLVNAAREVLLGESQLVGFEVEISGWSRSTCIVSSHWGTREQGRDWITATVSARARNESGARARALRSRGAASLDGLDARSLVQATAAAALARLDARPAPGGRPAVIVAGGAAGVLLHEAVGHALEGDVVARGSSFLASRMGEQVASETLTVVDDPSLPNLAGSYLHDDEGAPAREALLIERGMLRGVMTDALRSGFDPAHATGHGRRQGFRDNVLPRMTNTLVLAGPWDPAELLAGIAGGLIVTRLERASADPLRGRFQVRATEGYLIENGVITAPLRETLLVGISDDLLRGLDVGGDAAWDDGAGSCGREAQWVSVAIGNPTLRAAPGVFGVA